ncbi:MAG: hypothetical protein IPN89_06125 [Saprospiraceae bacterium]|nr:hypothetical protein [Saprospiraceae bacterium]
MFGSTNVSVYNFSAEYPVPEPSYSPEPSLAFPEPASPSSPLSLPARMPDSPLPVPPGLPSTVDGLDVDVLLLIRMYLSL